MVTYSRLDGGGVLTTAVNYLDSDLLHNVELLQWQGMFWVIDRSDQMYRKVKNDSDLFIICFICEDPSWNMKQHFFLLFFFLNKRP